MTDSEKKPQADQLSSKFVWDDDDVGAINIDNSQAEGEPFDLTPASEAR